MHVFKKSFSSSQSAFRLSLVAGLMLLSGCASLDVKKETTEKTEALRKGPETKPQRNMTNFSQGLRCMDNMMIFYGVKDVSVLVEDLVDNTKKVNAGTRDMLISATSDMTRRSRAIRLIAHGQDMGNATSFMANAATPNAAPASGSATQAYSVMPQYDIRGSISQLDEGLIQNQNESGINIAGFGIGHAKTAHSSILGLDLNMISMKDLAIIPGVTARNSVIIYKEGDGYDGELEYKKFGVSFGMTLAKSEGQTQALRNLVELATVELFGKLLKLPYWQCLGASDEHESVKNEIADWFYAMTAQSELVPFVQKQLRQRGYYQGVTDGSVNPAFLAAVQQSRRDLNLPAETTVDLPYFSALLNSTKVATANAAPTTSSAPKQPIKVQITHKKPTAIYKPNEPVNLTISVNQDAHLYCYIQDETHKIQRFFPNRFTKDSFIKAGQNLEVPGKMGFQFMANTKNVQENIACFASEKDVWGQLPASIQGTDFEYLSIGSIEQIHTLFKKIGDTRLGENQFHVKFK
ncbi:MAG: DUF4384 domain-containing protein [Pseudomonadota bacterium]